MRCPKCHHDSICIETSEQVSIKCSNCKTNIVVEKGSPLLRLFTFNYDLEKAKGD